MPDSEKKKRAENRIPDPVEVQKRRIIREKKLEAKIIDNELLETFKVDPEIYRREKFKGDKDLLFEYKSNLEKVKDKFTRTKYRQNAGKDDNRYQYIV
jgi:hypothetical protein